jgi:CRISPR-associated endonuclease Csn1
MHYSNYTLGIDMGVASIGWAVVSTAEKKIASGVRIFPAGQNLKLPKEEQANYCRRTRRLARRRVRRKAERKKMISKALMELSWMPHDSTELETWHQQNVYEIRHRALFDKISLSELGRIIIHLNQRRGFLSLRKEVNEKNEKEEKKATKMLSEISALQNEIDASGHKTLGNHLYHLYQKDGIHVRLRNRHIRRQMLHHEFSLIWEKQRSYYPELLTDALRYGTTGKLDNPTKVVKPIPRVKSQTMLEQFGIENLTFFQRRVYWPASSVGKCELEPTEFRAPLADRRFQEFRMLQEVNNLRILDGSKLKNISERHLTEEERAAAVKFLSGRETTKFEDLKKCLAKVHGSPQTSQITFNLENGGRKGISSMSTDHKLANAKALGKEWLKFSVELKNKVVAVLADPRNATDEDIEIELDQIGELTSEQITKLTKVSLPVGFGNLSIKALDKLLPHMRCGKIYMAKDFADSAMHAAGYLRRDENEHKIFDILPLIDSPDLPYAQQINNPVVLRSLNELRKVVNAIIRKYGKPARIHLEMARDLKMSPKQRADYQKQTRANEKERESVKDELLKLKIIPTRDAIDLYRLWKEQGERCAYTGKSISILQLLGGEIDMDHILPYSRSADNSLGNKVVCFRSANHEKGNRTPYEWLAVSAPDRYEALLQNTKHLNYSKRKRFAMEEIPESFVNRDLNDTAWMARAARQYLSHIVEKPHHVLGTKGTHTATLRDQWQLHSLLRNDGLDLKNRDDHRHHALDAIIIALCDQSRIHEILKKKDYENRWEPKPDGMKVYRLKFKGDALGHPWESFRSDVENCLNSIWVSHKPKGKISGPLHKETNYGKTKDGLLVVRKNVSGLSAKEVEGIRDPAIKKVVKDYIGKHGDLKTISPENPLRMPSGLPILKVRTAIPYAHITIRKGTEHETHVQSESTHHLAIFSLGDRGYHFEPVTLFEVSRRKSSRQPIISKTPPSDYPEAEFVMYLCSNDSIIAEVDGREELFVFKGVHATQLTAKFVYHQDARKNNDKDPITGKAVSIHKTCGPNTLEINFPKFRKVTVLPTGEIRNCG